MNRNCNLELRLLTPSVSFNSSDHNIGRYNHSTLDMEAGISPNKKQKLTIFYNGSIASCDATELQARAIISLASRELEEKSNNLAESTPSSPVVNSPIYSPTTGLSMKRSLQRFLEKRKTRVQSSCPYPITIHHNLFN